MSVNQQNSVHISSLLNVAAIQDVSPISLVNQGKPKHFRMYFIEISKFQSLSKDD